MTRSEINRILHEAIAFCHKKNFHLPMWACWSPDDWARAGCEADEIRRCGLGWDVTDFNSGRFDEMGLTLFTIRNGEPRNTPDPMVKDYCEKLLIVGENQVTPIHFHWAKMEDIINRSGGRFVLQLWNADRNTEARDEQGEVTVSIDGMVHKIQAGGKIVLEPGESITLPPYLYHSFWAEAGSGTVLAGEVSRVNDDVNDNRFFKPMPRYPGIEEDEKPLHLLCMEYPPVAK